MDFKEIITWSLRHWYLYLVSLVLCAAVGAAYYICMPRSYNVAASIMLRQTDGRNTAQNEMIDMMGLGGGKITSDEVEVLMSYSLIQKVVEKLGLTTVCEYKKNGFWLNLYPASSFSLVLPQDVSMPLCADFRVKNGEIHRLKLLSDDLDIEVGNVVSGVPFTTPRGGMRLVCNTPDVPDGHYRVSIVPEKKAVLKIKNSLVVSRISRESKIIAVSMTSQSPACAVDIINTLLFFYNGQAVSDKNLVAMQAEEFLDSRLAVLSAQLDSAEAELEDYKRTHLISNIDQSAGAYRSYSDQYQRKVAEMDAEADVLDFIRTQISKPENENTVIPGNLGISDAALQRLIIDYNALILERSKLLQTATPDNPVVQQLTGQVQQRRSAILEAIDKARLSLQRMREHERSQQELYDERLGGLPQQERRYQEMLRELKAKEKAYIYLVEKKEGNALLLASGALPAKIVDPAIVNPIPESPRLRFVAAAVLVFGFMLPLLVFFIGLLKREFLG
ncbi:MAG: hypothetical protein II970_00390 [Paludibacteraceae bacterium]|nr:hypothetical protein [Paludibacteraceae bacterium]